MLSRSFCVLAAAAALAAGPVRTYVASLDDTSVTLAWGTVDGTRSNTIGRGAPGIGRAVIAIDGRREETADSWLRIGGLAPDTSYPYTIEVDGRAIGSGSVRTWAREAQSLTFFVIGDFGNASRAQYDVAARMEAERRRLDAAGDPVRFVLTTGDNIYGRFFGGGNSDADWEPKFFRPYAETLKAIPFYATVGNHDGNESERAADLPVYLDNFFFPGNVPARWYHFNYGGLADFYALDSTRNQLTSAVAPVYSPGGDQSRWLEEQLARARAPWRITYMHHPMFTAGPDHAPSLQNLNHWFRLFQQSGVQAVFAGHEHNFQYSTRGPATGNIQFVVSGAGGEQRTGNILRKMQAANIAAWSPAHHFLVVKITPDQMTVQPVGDVPMQPVDPAGRPVSLPLTLSRN